MLQLTSGVERIDVDDDKAGPKDAAHRDRVLQDVRQHDGDAFALDQPKLVLQVAGKLQR